MKDKIKQWKSKQRKQWIDEAPLEEIIEDFARKDSEIQNLTAINQELVKALKFTKRKLDQISIVIVDQDACQDLHTLYSRIDTALYSNE